MILPARPPFSLATVTDSHGWVQLAPFTRDSEGNGFSYIVRIAAGRVVELRVTEAPDGVCVQTTPGLSETELPQLASYVEWMLGLNQDFGSFYRAAEGEPKLAHVAARAQGRLLHSATLFEDVVKTILTTNTTWAGTKRMVGNLTTLYGSPLAATSGSEEAGADRTARSAGSKVEHAGGPGGAAFPTAEQLAVLDEDALRNQARLGFRAPSVLAAARAVASGVLDIEGLKTSSLPTLELRKQLLTIRGVGDYAAAHLLILLGHYDFLPIDSWALKMVSREWHNGQPIGRPEVEAAFARWGEWKALAYWFWRWSST